MSGHESWSLGSEYILNKILRVQARLLVSCFSRLGLDLPLKPEEEKGGQSQLPPVVRAHWCVLLQPSSHQ